jgi:cytochrome c oxidase subunit 2
MNHDALAPAGPFAAEIAGLFWVFVAVATVVYAVVIGFLVHALRRRRIAADARAPTAPAVLRGVGIAAGVTALTLVVLACSDFIAGRVLARVPDDAMRVRVTAHQWWWDIEYLDATPARRVRTANELHIPTDRPVLLELTSRDVIHSFWVPSLQGKKDLLPGYTTTLTLRASRPGLYTGECAEFCGFQHAHMSIDVHASAPADFSNWMEAQLASGAPPDVPEEARGQAVFMSSSCAMCHAIQGSGANARLGPDLTHVGSRRRIAAGTLPNTPENLAAWISRPHDLKPGTRMPATSLNPDELGALVTYLASLK